MKSVLSLSGVLLVGLLGVGEGFAAVTYYPAADFTHSYTGPFQNGANVIVDSPAVSLAAADRFQDPGTSVASPSATRYYGGFYTYTPNYSPRDPVLVQFGGAFEVRLILANGQEVRFGKPHSILNLQINALTGVTQPKEVGSYDGDQVELPFILKFEDEGSDRSRVSVFVGPNALTATEGTPDKVLTDIVPNVDVQSIATSYRYEWWGNDTSVGKLEGFFASSEWSPVVIPEPATLTSVGIIGAVLLGRRRRTVA